MARRYNKKHYPWSLRNWVQLAVFVLTIAIGIQFYYYVIQVSGIGDVTIPRPPGVEGFLPIGSLMAWKHFLLTGHWDMVHPAGMVIIGFAILISWLLRKTFCGWFCPVGTLSEWLWRLGQRMFGRNFQFPKWLDIPLRSLKYILMAFFVFFAVLASSIPHLKDFLETRYWIVSDIKMMYFFSEMSIGALIIILFLGVGSLFVRNFWCRYLCPYGALVGLFSMISPTRVVRNEEKCSNCGLCTKVCPAYLPVDKKPFIQSAECTGCMNCTEICPINETMTMQTVGIKKNFWTLKTMSVAVVGSFVFLVVLARIFGVWESTITIEQIREIFPLIPYLQHT